MTKNEKHILLSFGYLNDDLFQLNECLKKCKITINNKRITKQKAIDVLGLNVYLSGIGRSCFHWTCTRENSKGIKVCFDFSNYFKEVY